MTTDKLYLYNVALRAVGERRLGSLTEDREPRHLLDEVWSGGQGAVKYFLEQAFWDHAMRAVEIDAETSITPAFGYSKAFTIPDDYVRLDMISADDRFGTPLTDYEIEAGYIYADVDPLYLRYVSDHSSYGGDMGKWPETFSLWAGTWMATQIAPRLKNDIDKKELMDKEKRYRIDARSKDASQAPTRWPPLSSWAGSRLGRGRRERGERGQLIGR